MNINGNVSFGAHLECGKGIKVSKKEINTKIIEGNDRFFRTRELPLTAKIIEASDLNGDKNIPLTLSIEGDKLNAVLGGNWQGREHLSSSSTEIDSSKTNSLNYIADKIKEVISNLLLLQPQNLERLKSELTRDQQLPKETLGIPDQS